MLLSVFEGTNLGKSVSDAKVSPILVQNEQFYYLSITYCFPPVESASVTDNFIPANKLTIVDFPAPLAPINIRVLMTYIPSLISRPSKISMGLLLYFSAFTIPNTRKNMMMFIFMFIFIFRHLIMKLRYNQIIIIKCLISKRNLREIAYLI